jgi:hypothetical protein
MPTSLIAPAIGAGVTFGAQKLFGGSSGSPTAGLESFRPTGFQGGGFGTSFGSGGLTITPTAERLGLVGGLRDSFGGLAGELGGLRSRVAPGMSDLRAARLGEIESARSSAVGNLRDNLARRRVLGSSFGQDALSRAEAEFGDIKGKAAAETFMQEIEMTNNLINQQFAAARGQFQTGLDELNLEAGIASGLAAKATDTMGKNAQFLAALTAQEAAGAGKFFGETFRPVGKAIGDAAGKFDFGSLFPSSPSGSPGGLPVQA